MWIRPDRALQARMPSMRPQPSAAAKAPAAPTAGGSSRKAARSDPPPPPPPPPPPSTDEEERAAGGFHESSYELRTGMDMFEADWPEDTTIPGAFDDDD